MKPHIFKRDGKWWCRGLGVERAGRKPLNAYLRWYRSLVWEGSHAKTT